MRAFVSILYLELLFILLAAFIAAAVIYPIRQYQIDFPYLNTNICIIIISVILVRHVLLLRYSVINKYQKVKILLIPLSIFLIIFFIRWLNRFTTYIDETILADLCSSCSYQEQQFLSTYIEVEYILFSVIGLVSSFVLPIVLLRSVWREVNDR